MADRRGWPIEGLCLSAATLTYPSNLSRNGTTLNEAAHLTKELTNLVRGYWTTQAIYIAAELGISELLADGPRSPESLATEAKVESDALYRVLRALATIGIFTENDDGRFGLTPLAEALGSPGGKDFALIHGKELYQAWGGLLETVRSGKPAFKLVHDLPFFEYLTAHPERGRVFDRSIARNHAAETDPMLDAYDFSSFKEIVDVGGGDANVVNAILKRHSHMHGILFDLPAVVERARLSIEQAGLADRCRLVGGSFLESGSVPTGAAAYLARHVIHDWNDAEAVKILRHLKEAGGSQAKFLIVEIVIPTGAGVNFGKWSDLMMLCIGGKERTADEYRQLYQKAGLELTRIIPTSASISILEGMSSD